MIAAGAGPIFKCAFSASRNPTVSGQLNKIADRPLDGRWIYHLKV
jgi:hypothetical protein